ncbi:c-type cytochrome [Shumkonia mesophila]|uniref:c-type cytochrome n=1 Tax=Shumkonia mesophila TaxID=2838854 RepID=UPI0029345E92|nr:c-type cytochrome [Shumkonia mesophila]
MMTTATPGTTATNCSSATPRGGGAAIAPAEFKSGMPAFGEALSDEQIWAVLAFIKSTWPEPVRQRQDLMNR